MLKFSAKIFVFVSILLAISSAMNQAMAARVVGLYDVDILVADELLATRQQAFSQGLDEVFVRISGDSIVMDKLKRPPASRYVKQFSYDPVEEPEPDESGELLTHRLKIQYNGSAMEKYLLANGFAVWGEYRPDVVIWLVVRDGKNEYVLRDSDQSVLKTAMVDALKRRGIPNQWPVYDKKDKKILSVSDIRGGFTEQVVEASQRYSRGPALTGSMIWNGRKWQSSWSLLMKGENRHWNLDDADHRQLINKSIDQAADALGMVFAVHASDNKQQLASARLDVQGIGNIDSYHYVENYLMGLSAVYKVKPFSVDGKNAVFEVSLRSNETDFINLIKNDGELSEVESPDVEMQQVKTAEALTAVGKAQDASAAELPGVTEKASAVDETAAVEETGTGNKAGADKLGIADTGSANNLPAGQTLAEKNSAPLAEPELIPVYYFKLNQSR